MTPSSPAVTNTSLEEFFKKLDGNITYNFLVLPWFGGDMVSWKLAVTKNKSTGSFMWMTNDHCFFVTPRKQETEEQIRVFDLDGCSNATVYVKNNGDYYDLRSLLEKFGKKVL